jgi:tRNA(fMet)-specific endonuclease VapC
MICLDTNCVIALLNRQSSPVHDKVRRARLSNEVVAISTLVLFELWYGVAKSARRERNAQRIRDFCDRHIAILPFDEQDAEVAGNIRAELNRAGTPIGLYDLLIAAQARRRGATLVTANGREFGRVPGLLVEDWAV